MSFTNKITKSVLEMCGDISPKGYQLNDVPILLNKDKTTQYPEIRVSPFIHKKEVEYQRYMEKSYAQYRKYESGVFQIDIYSRNVIEAQKIYDKLTTRIYDFFNLETVIYNWNPNFKEIDTDIYKNIDYAVTGELFKDIYSVRICKEKLERVFCYDDLVLDSWYVDEDALYVCTKQDLHSLDIKVLMQGRLFDDGDAYSDRGLHFHKIQAQRNLSGLEANNVERISFDLFILFSHTREREAIPEIKKIRYPTRRPMRKSLPSMSIPTRFWIP